MVTTSIVWKFLKFKGNEAIINRKEYNIEHPGKIMGILMAMIKLKISLVENYFLI